MFNASLPIETSRFILRALNSADHDLFAAVMTEYDVRKRLRAHTREALRLTLVEKHYGAVLGYAELAINDIHDIELYCFILSEYRSQNYATEAGTALCALALQRFDFVTATTALGDLAGQILAKNLGMTLIGRAESGDAIQEYWSLERKDFLMGQLREAKAETQCLLQTA